MATAPRQIAAGDIPAAATIAALSNPVDFFDDFTAGTAGAFASGRVPTTGDNPWIVSGGGAGVARVGGAAGFTSSAVATGGGQNIYAIMKTNSGQVPAEIGGTFRWNGQAATLPTIAVIRDYDATGINKMVHLNLYAPNIGEVQFAPGYWDGAGGVNVPPAFALALFGTSGPSGALVLGQDYTRRIYLDQLPYILETIEDATGEVIATHYWCDPLLAGIVGPAVFFEGNGSDLSWRKVWAKRKASFDTRALLSRLSGQGATPRLGVFSGAHVGAGTPFGALSVRYDGTPSRRPGVRAQANAAEFEVRAEAAGQPARVIVTNGGGASGGMSLGGDYALKLDTVNYPGALKLQPNSGIGTFPGGVQSGDNGGVVRPSCSGSPNGQVTGFPGDLVTRLDGGAGATFYVKETGTNTNTGWVAK